jgi:hypothetical protein
MSSDRRKAGGAAIILYVGTIPAAVAGWVELSPWAEGWEKSQPLFYCVRQYDDFERCFAAVTAVTTGTGFRRSRRLSCQG